MGRRTQRCRVTKTTKFDKSFLRLDLQEYEGQEEQREKKEKERAEQLKWVQRRYPFLGDWEKEEKFLYRGYHGRYRDDTNSKIMRMTILRHVLLPFVACPILQAKLFSLHSPGRFARIFCDQVCPELVKVSGEDIVAHLISEVPIGCVSHLENRFNRFMVPTCALEAQDDLFLVMECLLQLGANPNPFVDENTPLLVMCLKECAWRKFTPLLYKYGAEPESFLWCGRSGDLPNPYCISLNENTLDFFMRADFLPADRVRILTFLMQAGYDLFQIDSETDLSSCEKLINLIAREWSYKHPDDNSGYDEESKQILELKEIEAEDLRRRNEDEDLSEYEAMRRDMRREGVGEEELEMHMMKKWEREIDIWGYEFERGAEFARRAEKLQGLPQSVLDSFFESSDAEAQSIFWDAACESRRGVALKPCKRARGKSMEEEEEMV
jgi:hypothetical protein